MFRLLLTFAFAAVFVFTAVGVALSRAALPPHMDGLQLVFSAPYGQDRAFYVIGMDGSGRHRLHADQHVIEYVTCSSNGQYVAVITRTGDRRARAVRVMAADGTPVHTFDVSHLLGVAGFSVSNDGAQVVVASADAPSHVRLFSPARPGGELVFTSEVVNMPTFSSDGERIAFVYYAGGQARMAVLRLEDGGLSFVPSEARGTSLPYWSSDTNVLQYVVDDTGSLSSYVRDLNTLRALKLRTETLLSNPGWLPDGLGFVTSDAGALTVYTLTGRPLTTILPQVGSTFLSELCFLTDRPQTLVQP